MFVLSLCLLIALQLSYSVEIAGGLGPTAGEIIRIGLMGENARQQHVDKAIDVLKNALKQIRGLSNL